MDQNHFKLESAAFKDQSRIPEDFTAHGKNISPPLSWSNVPHHAKELALICEDPDAPNPPYIHWLAYHILAILPELKENAGQLNEAEFAQGKNSAGENAYTGPKPPPHTGSHRYYFRLFALDEIIDIRQGASVDELMEAMRGHIIGEADVMGKHESH